MPRRNAAMSKRECTVAMPPPSSSLRVPRRPLARIIDTDKRPIHLAQPLEAILQRLGDIMGAAQLRVLCEHDVHFDPDAVAGVVCGDGLVGVHDGGEAPGEEGDLFEEAGGDGGAGEAGDVLEAGLRPVVDDEEGEEGGADGVEPPEVELVPDQWE